MMDTTVKHVLIGAGIVVGAIFLLRVSGGGAAAKIRASGGVQNVT